MKSLRYILCLLLLTLITTLSTAAPPEIFCVVFIDDQSVEKLGGDFPLPRDVLANGIEAIALQKPRGIILKLFIDQLQASITYPGPEHDELQYIGFTDLLDGTLDTGTFTDKIVILGYDGCKIPKIQTPMGELKAHRVFCYSLFFQYEKMRR